MLASFPASIPNHNKDDSRIPNDSINNKNTLES